MFGEGNYLADDPIKTDQYASRDEGSGSYDGTYVSGRASYPRECLRALHAMLYSEDSPHPTNVFYAIICRVVLGTYPLSPLFECDPDFIQC